MQIQQLAAIDLGSNSFHMVVARLVAGELQIQEGLSEKVQLAAGLDDQDQITPEAWERAMGCLARFAQRLAGVPPEGIRVVGTNALRVARNARPFLQAARDILGRRIEIIAGREEARLIYLGVMHYLPDQPGHTLVVDIGGGSTEVIIGEGFETRETESLHMGCVSYTRRFFADGQCGDKIFQRAITAARQEALTLQATYQALGWERAVGASGTVKTIAQVLGETGQTQGDITLEGLHWLRRRLAKAGHVSRAQLEGLRPDREPIFAAGVAILTGLFEQLGIRQMSVSQGALREGVLFDLLGRLDHEDVRERSILAMMKRNHVDRAQAERVAATADQLLLRAGAGDLALSNAESVQVLRWAALMHEVGLSVSHSQFHKHGAYLVENSDLPGFSKPEQQVLAVLVRSHRRRLSLKPFGELPDELRDEVFRLALLLRLAARLHHARTDEPLPELALQMEARSLRLSFPEGWLDQHPLTQADLEVEQQFLQDAGVRFRFG